MEIISDLAKADIFFFITSVAVAVVTVLLVVLLVRLNKISKDAKGIIDDVKHISGKARMEADNISEDLADLRGSIKSGKISGLRALYSFFRIFIGRKGRRKSNKGQE